MPKATKENEQIVADLLKEREKREEQGATEEEQEFDQPFEFELNEIELLKLENTALKKDILQKELSEVVAQEQDVYAGIIDRAGKKVGEWFVRIDPRNLKIAIMTPRPQRPQAPQEPEESDGS